MDVLGVLYVLSTLLVLALLAAVVIMIGFVVEPGPHRPHLEPTVARGRVNLPANLPGPVARHFVSLANGDLPRYETAVLWGRMRMRILGIWMPLRFRTYLEAGRQFSRRMDICWFGVPVATAVDSFLGGCGRLQFRGRTAGGPMLDQGQRLALWVETLFAPAVFVESSAMRWEPAGELRSRLKIDVGQAEPDTLTLDFHPQTGRLLTVSAPRSRAGGDSALWQVDLDDWQTRHGLLIPLKLTASWGDQRAPYGVMRIDGVVYNVDISQHLVPPADDVSRTPDNP